jgi:transposase
MGGEYKQRSGQEKLTVLRKHLLEKVSISKVCEESKVQPVVFYRWQKELFEKGWQVFGKAGRSEKNREKALEEKIRNLESKLLLKNEVLSELMEQHLALKKSVGET